MKAETRKQYKGGELVPGRFCNRIAQLQYHPDEDHPNAILSVRVMDTWDHREIDLFLVYEFIDSGAFKPRR